MTLAADEIRANIEALVLLLRVTTEECTTSIQKASDLISAALEGGKTIFFAGNGGSASQAIHLAAELVGRFKEERVPFPAIALTENVSTLTAVANDYDYRDVFSRQVNAFGRAGDVLVVLSTSGMSHNVVEAAATAKDRGMMVIALTGRGGGKLVELADVLIKVPETDVAHVQEVHLMIGHLLCSLADEIPSSPVDRELGGAESGDRGRNDC